MRATLRKLRAKGLAGKLSLAEFHAVRSQAQGETSPLRALLSTLRSAEHRAARVSTLPAEVRAEIERVVAHVARLLGTARRVASLSRPRGDAARA